MQPCHSHTSETASASKSESTADQIPSGETAGQRNAVSKAQSYLRIGGFSRESLIAQLEYEKISYRDAVYGADHCGANWNEQAARKAKIYLEIMPFSRESLINQLLYDKFTQEQAAYGAKANGL